MKDLPDLALLASIRALDARRLRAALEQTFEFRASHGLPASLPEPPVVWTEPYARMAKEDALRWRSLDEVTAAARAFLDPVLAEELDASWQPHAWAWTTVHERARGSDSP